MSSVNRKTFSPQEAAIAKVTVYRDRAEITRVLKTKTSPGEHEFLLAALPTYIDESSVRVEGKGAATITEVNVASNYTSKSQLPETDERVTSLREKLEKLRDQKDLEDVEQQRIEKQQKFWEKCTESLATGVFSAKEGKSFPATQETFTGLSDFLQYQANETRKLAELLRLKKLDVKKLQEDIETTERNLNECRGTTSQQTYDIKISVTVDADGELELSVSYIVYNARWSPKYDVRMSSDSKKLSVAYFGVITQSTGEDWVEVPLCLSTAQPAVGGNIPTLGTKQLSFKKPPPPPQVFGYGGAPGYARPMAKRMVQQECAVMEDVCFAAAPMAMQMKSAVTNVVADSGITTSFEIAKLTSIPSDGSEHKVTVGLLDLAPKMQYKAVPKKAEQAFLEAKAVNSSLYPILPGPASVFFGTNFVSTVELKTTSPQEDFFCSLGVDPAVKVKYRPVRRFNEQTGLLSKSNVVTYVQDIEINNTRPEPIHMIIVDQVPLSQEDTLKVTLVEPAVNQAKQVQGFVLNQDNNLEHTVDIKERSPYKWTIKYKLEYPSDKEIEETEVQCE